MIRLLVVIGVVSLSGCASLTDDPPTPSEAATERPTELPSLPNVPGSKAPDKARSITGTFASDAVEGGCAYLQADDGTKYQVLYPDGWSVERAPYRLVDPGGATAAEAGAVVTVRGRIRDDVMTTCQVGPVFEADEVVSIDGLSTTDR